MACHFIKTILPNLQSKWRNTYSCGHWPQVVILAALPGQSETDRGSEPSSLHAASLAPVSLWRIPPLAPMPALVVPAGFAAAPLRRLRRLRSARGSAPTWASTPRRCAWGDIQALAQALVCVRHLKPSLKTLRRHSLSLHEKPTERLSRAGTNNQLPVYTKEAHRAPIASGVTTKPPLSQ